MRHVQTVISVREPLWTIVERGELIVGGTSRYVLTASPREGKLYRYEDEVGGGWRRSLEVVIDKRHRISEWPVSKLVAEAAILRDKVGT